MTRFFLLLSVVAIGGCKAKVAAVQEDSKPSSSQPSKGDVESDESETTSGGSSTNSNQSSSSSSDGANGESSSTESSSEPDTEPVDSVDPVDLPEALCMPLPSIPKMGNQSVVHWLTVKADMLGASDLIHNPIHLRLHPSRIDLITGRRPIILDFSKNSICAYASPFNDSSYIHDALPLEGGKELLVYFQGGTAVMGRYSERGTQFQELPRGASGNASQFVELEATAERDACIAAEFGEHRLQLSFDRGDHWVPFPGKSLPYNFGALIDRGGEHLWTYGMFAMEAMGLEWYSASDPLTL